MNVDLIVGASILAALFIFVAGLLWLKDVSVSRQMVNYMVIFPEVGTLQLGDPVFANGVKMGTVRMIELRGAEVVTVLNIDRKVPLTDSASVAVVNVGLLGERGIGITLSPIGSPIPPVDRDSRDTVFVRGRFDTGVAEAMGMVGTMLAEVETLMGSISEVFDATVGDSVFVAQFRDIVDQVHDITGRVDTITVTTNRILRRTEPVLNTSMANLRDISVDLKAMLGRTAPGIDSLIVGGNILMARGAALVDNADSLVADVKVVISKIESGQGTLGKLYAEDTFFDDIKAVIAGVDSLIAEIQDDALKLRVRLGFRKKKR